jgi:hypothetical protein
VNHTRGEAAPARGARTIFGRRRSANLSVHLSAS